MYSPLAPSATLRTATAVAMALACWTSTSAELAQAASRHPQLVAGVAEGREALRARLAQDPATAAKFGAIKARVQPYVDRHRTDPQWIVSRLQMYWQGKHTEVYVKDSVYHHAEGQAPVPTVRFTGGRDSATAYMTPKLEDVKPYMGENDLLYLQNKTVQGQPWEWAPQAKTGRIVEAINMRIAELARDAAFLYWYSGDEAYAKFAHDIFDTYMTGMYYRETPSDLNRAHDGTIVGLQSYEVIHEDIVGPLTECYDFIHDYARPKAGMYDASLKKWADVIIANGVPWNNWNLIKARFVLHVAAVLEPDASYADGRGAGHYVRAVIDGSGTRQWSLKRLLEQGYDQKTGIWNESPSYSVNVLNDYLECLEMLERVFGIDLLPQMPVLSRAAMALPQYLLPNGRTVGFGDTRYDTLRTDAIEDLYAYAQRHGRSDDAQAYARLLAALRNAGSSKAGGPAGLASLFAHGGGMDDAPSASRADDYQTPTFHAPNASWLVQRNGYRGADARDNALVISQVGSAGNHAHANGIAMELFAQGLSLAPESGRGSGYLQNDHLQYYAQFPAHNTVVVDGASTYPSMKIDHPFKVEGVYPPSGSPTASAFPLATFSDVSFVEPATGAEQRRVLATIRLDEQHGYFVDVFRSRRRDGKDKYHDYIYHNLGQSMGFMDVGGKVLETLPSQRLSFADGDLFGYDFWSDRRSLVSVAPLKARFDLKLPDRTVAMTAWLQGGRQREFFAVQAPPSTAWTPGVLPEGIDRLPLQTLVIRQTGEAWSRPFSVVLEPGDGRVAGVEETRAGKALALRVMLSGGGAQTIVSTEGDGGLYAAGGKRLAGRYGVISERDGKLDYLFLGQGSEVAGLGYALVARRGGISAALWLEKGRWYYTGSDAVQLRVPAQGWPRVLEVSVGGKVRHIPGRDVGATRTFDMPAMPAVRVR